jgi:hypothetical protein
MENLETSLSIGMGMGFTSKAIVPLSPMLFILVPGISYSH